MRCTPFFENKFHGTKKQSCLEAATAETQRRVQSLKRAAEMVNKWGQRQGRGLELGELLTLLMQHTLEKQTSLLQEQSGEDGSVMENLYSIFTFKPLQNHQLQVFRLLKSSVVRSLSCDDLYSHRLGPAEKQRRLSSLKISLSKARGGILANVEERYAWPGLHLDFAKSEKTAQLNGLFTEAG